MGTANKDVHRRRVEILKPIATIDSEQDLALIGEHRSNNSK